MDSFSQKFGIAITYDCNMHRSCPYCYSKCYSSQFGPMRPKLAQDMLLWLHTLSPSWSIKFLGGEPTCHPSFTSLINALDALSFIDNDQIIVYTNGTAYNAIHDCLVNSRAIKGIVIHYDTAYEASVPNLYGRITKLCGAMLKADKSVNFRYNTSDPNFDFGVVWDLARKYSGNIIYSFTAPSKGVRQTVALEDYRLFVPGLLKAIEKAAYCGVELESSRPFPLCVLPQEERDEIMARAGIQVACHPYPTANPDGSLIICSPVFLWKSEPATCMKEFQSAMRAAQEMADSLQWKTPRLDKCLDCNFWHDRICQGGCLSYCNTMEA